MTSNRNKDGFTLIEVMMAMLILIVGMLGLLAAINVAIEVNLRNQLREEAVNVGERVMNEMRGKGFDNISAASPATNTYTYATYQLPSRIRGTTRNYNVLRESTAMAVDASGRPLTKQLQVTVTWNYKGNTFQNRVAAPISILR